MKWKRGVIGGHRINIIVFSYKLFNANEGKPVLGNSNRPFETTPATSHPVADYGPRDSMSKASLTLDCRRSGDSKKARMSLLSILELGFRV